MITVDWTKAPEWANFAAMEKNGLWWWFDKRPVLINSGWWCSMGEFCEPVVEPNVKDSLLERPPT